MIEGRCLCGGVQYEFSGEIRELAVCHCDMCKRPQGGPFATNAPIELALFHIVTGENLLKSYFSSEQKRRVFCRNCGSPLFSQRLNSPETIRLRVGTVTSGGMPQPTFQMHCESMAAWFVLDDDKPKYQQGKP